MGSILETTTGHQEMVKGTNGAAHVTALPGGTARIREITDLTSTAQTMDWSATPISAVAIYAMTPNLQVNGTFSEAADTSATGTNTSGWSWGSNEWTTSGSLATTAANNGVLTSDATAVIGRSYTITYTIGTAALASVVCGGVALANAGTGTFTETVTATGATSLCVATAAATHASATLDNVTIIETPVSDVPGTVSVVIDPANDVIRDAWFASTGSLTEDSQKHIVVVNGPPLELSFISSVDYIGLKTDLDNTIKIVAVGIEA